MRSESLAAQKHLALSSYTVPRVVDEGVSADPIGKLQPYSDPFF